MTFSERESSEVIDTLPLIRESAIFEHWAMM
jgi:hypothetical protein